MGSMLESGLRADIAMEQGGVDQSDCCLSLVYFSAHFEAGLEFRFLQPELQLAIRGWAYLGHEDVSS